MKTKTGGLKTSEKITALMKENPSISVPELAAQLQITTRGVEKQIALLKKKGTIRRIGPAKGGHWEVLE